MLLELETPPGISIIDVRSRVTDSIPTDATDGICTIFIPHTTAGLIINENEARLVSDFINFFEELVPGDADYEHDRIDNNAAAHILTTIIGADITIPLINNELALGTWQSIMFVECDGPRKRTIRVKTITE